MSYIEDDNRTFDVALDMGFGVSAQAPPASADCNKSFTVGWQAVTSVCPYNASYLRVKLSHGLITDAVTPDFYVTICAQGMGVAGGSFTPTMVISTTPVIYNLDLIRVSDGVIVATASFTVSPSPYNTISLFSVTPAKALKNAKITVNWRQTNYGGSGASFWGIIDTATGDVYLGSQPISIPAGGYQDFSQEIIMPDHAITGKLTVGHVSVGGASLEIDSESAFAVAGDMSMVVPLAIVGGIALLAYYWGK